MKWSKETITHCLNMYASYPCLWDPNCSDYKNKKKRACAMEEILRNLNINGFSLEMLKTKIHSIRNTYTNEKRKIEKSKKGASSGLQIYVPKISWFAFADSFLGKVFNSRRTRLKIDTEETPYDAAYATSFTQELRCEDSNISTPPVVESPLPKESIVKKERENGYYPPICERVESLIKTSASSQEDELDVFGKSMIAQMRKLPEVYAIELMSEIQSLLASKRLKFIADKRHADDQELECKYNIHP